MVIQKVVSPALVFLVLLPLVWGLFISPAMAGTDLANPNTSAAEARAIDQATQHQAQLSAIDLQYYAIDKQRETEFLQQQRQLKLANLRAEADADRKAAEMRLIIFQLLAAVVGFSVAILCIAGTVAILRASRPRAIPPLTGLAEVAIPPTPEPAASESWWGRAVPKYPSDRTAA